MKLRKTLALTLILCMAVSILSIGMVSAAALDLTEPATQTTEAPTTEATEAETETPTDGFPEVSEAGGWAFSDVSAENCTDEEKAVLADALADQVGVNYEPKDIIATQVVAGTNYAYLCKATPVTQDPTSYWAIVTVYVDLEGNKEIVNIAEIDPAKPNLIEETGDAGSEDDGDSDGVDGSASRKTYKAAAAAETASGAWTSTVKTNEAPLSDAVNAALHGNDGVAFHSIAVLGTQIVAGTNYRILSYGTTSTADPQTDLYVVDIYENLAGDAEITSVGRFALSEYVTPAESEAAEEETEAEAEEEAEEETEAEDDTADDPKPDSKGTPKSPATGAADNTIFVIMIVMIAIMGAGVSVYALSKKRG